MQSYIFQGNLVEKRKATRKHCDFSLINYSHEKDFSNLFALRKHLNNPEKGMFGHFRPVPNKGVKDHTYWQRALLFH